MDLQTSHRDLVTDEGTGWLEVATEPAHSQRANQVAGSGFDPRAVTSPPILGFPAQPSTDFMV